jgi:hypothetical protein
LGAQRLAVTSRYGTTLRRCRMPKDTMFHYTDTKWVPWLVVDANDKRRAASTPS